MDPKHRWNIERLKDDMAVRGMSAQDVALLAEVHTKTIHRFLRREYQTARTMAKIAGVLGHPVRRYLVEEYWHQPQRKKRAPRKPPKTPEPTVDAASQSNAPD